MDSFGGVRSRPWTRGASMRALSALLCLVFLPAIGRANCIQEGIEIAAGYQQQLPASVTPKERETVESAAGTQVEHAVCSRMAPGRMDLERSQEIGRAS